MVGITSFHQVLALASSQMTGMTPNTLIKHADTAMYYVKERGKNNFQLFTAEMNQEFYRKMMIEKHLRTALDNENLNLIISRLWT